MGDATSHRAAKKALSDHLFDAHQIMLTRAEFQRMTMADVRALDPCNKEPR